MSTCILYSSLTTDALQEMAQRRMDNLFLSHKLDFIKIDGSEAERKEIRDKLFSVSGQRGKYPQCFLEKDGEYKFIGLWNKVFSHFFQCELLYGVVHRLNN